MQTDRLEEKFADMDVIVLGGGCFWCVEAAFRQVPGVVDVTVGYTGGTLKNPTYQQVTEGWTGHAEVARISYHPQEVDLRTLMRVYFSIHDPTQLNRQGADIGTQYRSAVFYTSARQKEIVQEWLQYAQANYEQPIVTTLSALEMFYEAEAYHQRYFEKNPNAAYCKVVIAPKVEKVRGMMRPVDD